MNSDETRNQFIVDYLASGISDPMIFSLVTLRDALTLGQSTGTYAASDTDPIIDEINEAIADRTTNGTMLDRDTSNRIMAMSNALRAKYEGKN